MGRHTVQVFQPAPHSTQTMSQMQCGNMVPVCPSSQQATRTRLSTPSEDLRSFKLTVFFCRSSVRWRDSLKFHQEGRNQLLPYLARGCLYLRAPPRRQVGNRFQTCLTSAHSSLSTAIPTFLEEQRIEKEGNAQHDKHTMHLTTAKYSTEMKWETSRTVVEQHSQTKGTPVVPTVKVPSPVCKIPTLPGLTHKP